MVAAGARHVPGSTGCLGDLGPNPNALRKPWGEGASLQETLKQTRIPGVELGTDLRLLKGQALESRRDYFGMD